MGDGPSKRYGFLQDILLLVVSVRAINHNPDRRKSAPRNSLLTTLSQSSMMYYVARSIVSSLPTATDPEKEQHEQARVKAAANLRRIDRLRGDSNSDDESEKEGKSARRPRKEDLELDQYENQIAMEVVAPEDIPVGFEGMLKHDASSRADLSQISVGLTTSSKNSRSP
jgi:hypothetical protein